MELDAALAAVATLGPGLVTVTSAEPMIESAIASTVADSDTAGAAYKPFESMNRRCLQQVTSQTSAESSKLFQTDQSPSHRIVGCRERSVARSRSDGNIFQDLIDGDGDAAGRHQAAGIRNVTMEVINSRRTESDGGILSIMVSLALESNAGRLTAGGWSNCRSDRIHLLRRNPKRSGLCWCWSGYCLSGCCHARAGTGNGDVRCSGDRAQGCLNGCRGRDGRGRVKTVLID